ncbi:HGGxSTG domain-containing protein [Orrella sp. JC864]|uniref:HGGxSTG domain-containing protein n=1 Tax=Orrella sp. JC864 TaxID=3120298 RepID=UPI003009B649
MALCGAKTRSGQPCQNRAMTNGRCRMHGGKASTTHKGNQYARTHGIYSSHLTDDELAVWNDIELGRVDDELRLTRIRLARALAAENRASGGLELEERTEQDATVNGVPLGDEDKVVTERFKRRDYAALIDRLTARIESLERTRVELTRAAAAPPDQGDAQDGSPPEDYVLTPDESGPQKPIL